MLITAVCVLCFFSVVPAWKVDTVAFQISPCGHEKEPAHIIIPTSFLPENLNPSSGDTSKCTTYPAGQTFVNGISTILLKLVPYRVIFDIGNGCGVTQGCGWVYNECNTECHREMSTGSVLGSPYDAFDHYLGEPYNRNLVDSYGPFKMVKTFLTVTPAGCQVPQHANFTLPECAATLLPPGAVCNIECIPGLSASSGDGVFSCSAEAELTGELVCEDFDDCGEDGPQCNDSPVAICEDTGKETRNCTCPSDTHTGSLADLSPDQVFKGCFGKCSPLVIEGIEELSPCLKEMVEGDDCIVQCKPGFIANVETATCTGVEEFDNIPTCTIDCSSTVGLSKAVLKDDGSGCRCMDYMTGSVAGTVGSFDDSSCTEGSEADCVASGPGYLPGVYPCECEEDYTGCGWDSENQIWQTPTHDPESGSTIATRALATIIIFISHVLFSN